MTLASLLQRSPAERTLGPFLLVELLGSSAPTSGGRAVWRAREILDGEPLREVALKLYDVDDSAARARVVNEARSLYRVSHPGVAVLHTLVIDDALGVIGLVMELVSGRALSERLETEGNLGVATVVAVGRAIAGALEAAHAAGVVHCDIHPRNVVERGGAFKLLDFGGARAGGAAEALSQRAPTLPERLGIDAAGQSLRACFGDEVASGTVGYADPVSVATGRPATEASDVYALGAMLFECITGRVPALLAGEEEGLTVAVLDGRAPAPALATAAPFVPLELAELIDEMLAVDKVQRPSAGVVFEELGRIEQRMLALGHAHRRARPLLSPLVEARIHAALTDGARASSPAAARDVYHAATRRLLGGPLAGAGHEVVVASLQAARGTEAEASSDAAAIAKAYQTVFEVLVSSAEAIQGLPPAALRVDSRFRRDDPETARYLLERLEGAYVVDERLRGGGHDWLSARMYYELGLELHTHLLQHGRCPAVVAHLSWLVGTPANPSDGIRVGAIATAILRELRLRPEEPTLVLPSSSWSQVDDLVDLAVAALGETAREHHLRDPEETIPGYEEAIATIVERGCATPSLSGLATLLRDGVSAAAGVEDATRRAHRLRRLLYSVLSGSW